MLSTRTTILITALTGVVLELGIEVVTGRREAWDSSLYWTIGLPVACALCVAVGFFSVGTDWLWTIVIVPSQVMTMIVRSGEPGGLWPLAVIFSTILSAPFLVAGFI